MLLKYTESVIWLSPAHKESAQYRWTLWMGKNGNAMGFCCFPLQAWSKWSRCSRWRSSAAHEGNHQQHPEQNRPSLQQDTGERPAPFMWDDVRCSHAFLHLGYGYLHAQGPRPDPAQHKQPPSERRRKRTGRRATGRRESDDHSQRGDTHWAGEKGVPVLLSLPGEEHTGRCATPERNATCSFCRSHCSVLLCVAYDTQLQAKFLPCSLCYQSQSFRRAKDPLFFKCSPKWSKNPISLKSSRKKICEW